MKKDLLFLCTLTLSIGTTPLHCENMFGGFGDGDMSDFFGDSGFDFGNMDFGNMDFGGDNDPFASLFGGGGDDDEGEDLLEEHDDSDVSKDKTKAAPPKEAASLEEAFIEGVGPEVKKLTKQYKEALANYLAPLAVGLEKLIANLTTFTLGIRHKKELATSRTVAAEALELVDKLRTSSLYHIAFLQKEFTDLRKKLMGVIPEIEVLNNNYATQAGHDTVDLLDMPDANTAMQHQKLADSVKAAIEKKLQPCIADLKKVFEHKGIQARLAQKKKKYAPKIAGSRAGAAGGWNSRADDYFDSGYSSSYGNYGGYGNDYYGGSSGGYSWDDGGYSSGGYGGYNSYGGYNGSDNSYRTSDRSSSKSSTTSPQTIYPSGMRANNSLFNFDDNYGSGNTEKTSRSSTVQDQALLSDATPKEQVVDLIKRLPISFKKWERHYKNTETPGEKTSEVRVLLESPGFATDIERLLRLMELYPEVKESLSDAQNESFNEFLSTLPSYAPMIVAAATYASPAYAKLFEEKTLVTQQGLSRRAARQNIEKAQAQRRRTYRALMQWLHVVRTTHTTHKKLFGAIKNELFKHARRTLQKLEQLSESLDADLPLSLEQAMQLNTLSRRLFHEPIALFYASPFGEDASDEATINTTSAMEEKQKAAAALVRPIVQKQYALFHDIILILQEATDATRQELGSDDDVELDLTSQDVLHVFSQKISHILATSKAQHPEKELLRKMLIPCEQQKFQQFEIEHTLLDELVKFWKPSAEEEAAALAAAEETLTKESPDAATEPETAPVAMQVAELG